VNSLGTTRNAPAPHQRLRELAAILATGIQRLRTNRSAWPDSSDFSAESSPSGLEAVATTRPDGVGLARESAEANNAD